MINSDLLDRLNILNSCLSAVSELLRPQLTLEAIDRDHFATLMQYLTDDFEKTVEALTQADYDNTVQALEKASAADYPLRANG